MGTHIRVHTQTRMRTYNTAKQARCQFPDVQYTHTYVLQDKVGSIEVGASEAQHQLMAGQAQHRKEMELAARRLVEAQVRWGGGARGREAGARLGRSGAQK